MFVINVGDCMSELTGGHLPSTLHQVIPRPTASKSNNDNVSRTSLGMFVGLDKAARLVLPEDGEVLSYEEWRRRRIARALDVIKS